MIHSFEFGDASSFSRALVVQGTALDQFFRRPGAHPHTVLVVVNITPTMRVYTDKHQTAEPILDGGFNGNLSADLPFEELNEDNDEVLYEHLGLTQDTRPSFKEAYNKWVTSTKKKLSEAKTA